MNPLSLLTKGRTFIGFKNRPSAYKLAKGMVVPNFSAGKSGLSPTFAALASATPTPSHREAVAAHPVISQTTLFPPAETQTLAQTKLNPAEGGQEAPSGSAVPTGILSYDSVPKDRQDRESRPESAAKKPPSGGSPVGLQAEEGTPNEPAGTTDILSYDSMPIQSTQSIESPAKTLGCEPISPAIPPQAGPGESAFAPTDMLSYDSMPPHPKPQFQAHAAPLAAQNVPAPRNGQSLTKPLAKSAPKPISKSQSGSSIFLRPPGPVRAVRSLLPEATHIISSRLGAVCQQFFQRWSPGRKAQPFHVPTVQTELALDKVTVVRNDLSEDDLEVVGVGMRKKKSAKYDQCQALSTNR